MSESILQEAEQIIEAEARRLREEGLVFSPPVPRGRESDPVNALSFCLLVLSALILSAWTLGALAIQHVISVNAAVLSGVISWILIQFLAVGYLVLIKGRRAQGRPVARRLQSPGGATWSR